MELDLGHVDEELRKAVIHFWRTRLFQETKQGRQGARDHGARAAVTGGKQMDGFADLICGLVKGAGIPKSAIHRSKAIELPGYFRSTKQWDVLVVRNGELLAVIEMKSQVGPSFGNNFNNRTEEAIGSAVDIWTAYREGAFGKSSRPWLGYVFLLEDCPKSQVPVSVDEPHFAVFPEFKNASYAKRYELLCRKLVLERHYEAAAFITSPAVQGSLGAYTEPAADLSMTRFASSLMAKMVSFVAAQRQSK